MARLSIILPNYNDGAIIEATLRRFVAQTRRVDEIIVIDDGSTDDSRDRIQAVADKNSNIRMLMNDTNKGAIAALTTAFEHASADYAYFAAADDGIGPRFTETLLGLAEKYPAAGICCSDTVIRGRIRRTPVRHRFTSGFMSPAAIAATLDGQHIYSTGTIYQRDLLPSSYLFDPVLSWHADWFANMVLAFRHGMAFAPEILSFIKHRSNSFSNRGRNNWAIQAGVIERVFTLLNSQEFRDVLPAFIQSKALEHFGGDALRLLKQRPDLMTDTNIQLAGGTNR